MTVETSKCPRCAWELAPGEVICSRCGADASHRAERWDDWQEAVRPTLTQTLETQLLSNLQHAVLGEYEIIGRLGRGGMCAVYLARDLTLERYVAIKVVVPELVSGFGIAQQRLRREARTAAGLSHPNIIPIYAVRETRDLVYLVMKYVEGRPLNAVLKQAGPLPVEVVRSILQQIGSGLEYAHRRGTVHRDIKPANIMIEENGWAVLADFGIAKVRDAQEITASGATIGTPCYMSPEQCSGLPATPASDQYSLGVVGYEMLTGKPPFVGDSVASVITQHLFERPAPIVTALPDDPEDVSTTLLRMLEKSPEERWPSLKECLGNLEGTPLPHADTGRAHMAEIVRSVPATDPVGDFSTPHSPAIPAFQSTGTGTTSSLGGSAGVSLARRLTAVVGIVTLSVAASLTISQLTGGDSTTPANASIQGAPPASVIPTLLEDSVDGNQAAESRGRPSSTVASPGSRPDPDREPTPVQGFGTILLGTRGQAAVLYMDDKVQGVINRLHSWPAPPGRLRVSIRAENCEPTSTRFHSRRELRALGFHGSGPTGRRD